MANYIITNRREYFEKVGEYNYCSPSEVILPKIVACDSETEGLLARDPKHNVFAIQLGTGTNNYLFDMETVSFEEVRPLLLGKILIFHNAAFDLGWFYVKYNFWPEEVGDTMLASMILHNGKTGYNGAPYRHGFAFVMERELGLEYDKSEQKNIAKIKFSTARAIEYMFNDVDRLLDLHRTMVEKLTDTDAIPVYRLHRRYIKALAYMEQCGFPVSPEKWKVKCESDRIELKEAEDVVIEYIYDNCPRFQDNQGDLFTTKKRVKINLGSPKQMIPIFEAFGINVTPPDDPEKKSIQIDVISKTKHPFVDIWKKMQQIKHDVTTYGENLLEKIEDGYFYTSFHPIKDTARISTRREGINILNFPKGEKTRDCFQAHPGYKIIVCDYAGQETRTGADITEDAAMIDSIVNDSCLHCAFARILNPELRELSDAEIMKNHGDKRQAAKSPRFCFQFGGTGYTLHQDQNIPLDEAMNIESAYRELHSGIYAWGDEKIKEAIELGYILSSGGFRLYLPNYEDYMKSKRKIDQFDKAFWKLYKEGKQIAKDKYRAEENKESFVIENPRAYEIYMTNKGLVSYCAKKRSEYYKLVLNNPTQQKAALQTKEAASMVFEYIVEKGHQWKARIANIPHDEMILEVTEELAEEYREVLGRCMREGGDKYLEKGLFHMEAEANIGDTWYEAK